MASLKERGAVEPPGLVWENLVGRISSSLPEANLYVKDNRSLLDIVEYSQPALAVFLRAPSPLGGSFGCVLGLLNSSAFAYVLSCLFFILLKCAERAGPVLVEAFNEAYYYPKLWLLYFFTYLFKPSLLAALWVFKFIFFSFVTLSYAKYFFWLLLVLVSYACVSSFKEECAKDLEDQKEIPGWAHEWALETLTRRLNKKKWLFRALLPLAINLLFGYPTLIGVGYQQRATTFLLACLIPYLIALSLIYGRVVSASGLALPIWAPSLTRKLALLDQRTTLKRYKDLTLEEKYDLVCDYPFLPPFIYNVLIGLKVRAWRFVYYTAGLLLILLAFILLAILSINLEGLVGAPLAGES